MDELIQSYKKDLKNLKHFELINYIIFGFGSLIWFILILIGLSNKDDALIFLSNIMILVFFVDIFAVNLAYIKPKKSKLINDGHYQIVKTIVQDSFPKSKYNYNYTSTDNMAPIDIYSSGIITKNIVVNPFNHISTVYNGVLFRFCTFKYTEKIHIGWFILNCKVEPDSSIFIVSKDIEIEENLRYKQTVSPLLQVPTNNIEFNNLFNVFCYDNYSSQKILNEKLMNKIIKFHRNNNCHICLSIDNGVVHIGLICNRELFAPMVSINDSVENMIDATKKDIYFMKDCLYTFDFSEYVSSDYTDFKIQNNSIYYTGKDVDKKYY